MAPACNTNAFGHQRTSFDRGIQLPSTNYPGEQLISRSWSGSSSILWWFLPQFSLVAVIKAGWSLHTFCLCFLIWGKLTNLHFFQEKDCGMRDSTAWGYRLFPQRDQKAQLMEFTAIVRPTNHNTPSRSALSGCPGRSHSVILLGQHFRLRSYSRGQDSCSLRICDCPRQSPSLS